ncbi:hypothetical protein MRQ36_05185 [Micromonospora sp. R77]|uniref:hypothetical protein n=1 Tax=Micromonospora sp. R77 TaxID=2925836 RepID=UPI001F614A59|nr:hypothetical protein [Micromonospora sp. R77]MCI4061990.1 hypothetical protein [Micromonospora sp. R77]
MHESRAHLPGMSGKIVADIVRLERRDSRLRPGDIHRALHGWTDTARGPARQLREDFGGCPCGCTLDHREVLDIALGALPRRAARQLRRAVDAADDLFLSRTLANPWADPRDPWWEQRL